MYSLTELANSALNDRLIRVLAEYNNKDTDSLSLVNADINFEGLRLLTKWGWPRL